MSDNIDGKPHYQVVIEHCPRIKAEAGQCVGICNIFAYIEVTGQLMIKEFNPKKSAYQYRLVDVDDKVLPLKAQMIFKIVDDNSSLNPSASWVVRDCNALCHEAAASPSAPSQEDYTDAQTASVPLKFQIETYPTPKGTDAGACCQVDLTFSWLKGTIPIAGGATGAGGGKGSALGGLVTPAGTGGISVTGGAVINGVSITLPVSFKICWDTNCVTNPSGDVNDAEAVYNAGGIRTPWPR
jgi:hypothetical protein